MGRIIQIGAVNFLEQRWEALWRQIMLAETKTLQFYASLTGNLSKSFKLPQFKQFLIAPKAKETTNLIDYGAFYKFAQFVKASKHKIENTMSAPELSKELILLHEMSQIIVEMMEAEMSISELNLAKNLVA